VAERALVFLHQAVSDLKTLEIECPQGSVACWVLQCCTQILVICQSVKRPDLLEECSHYTAPLLYYSLKKVYMIILFILIIYFIINVFIFYFLAV